MITLPQVAAEGSMHRTSSPSLSFIRGVTKYPKDIFLTEQIEKCVSLFNQKKRENPKDMNEATMRVIHHFC